MLTTYIRTEYADIEKRNKVQILHFQQTIHKQKKNAQGKGEREYLRFARNISFQVYLWWVQRNINKFQTL